MGERRSFLETFPGGIIAAGKWNRKQQSEFATPLLLVCEYGFLWKELEWQEVASDWQPEVGTSPLRILPLPCFVDEGVFGDIGARVQADGYPPLVMMFTLNENNFSIIRHGRPCEDEYTMEWQNLWLKDYDILREN